QYSFLGSGLLRDPDFPLGDQVTEFGLGGEVAKLLVRLGGVADRQGVDRVDREILVGEDPLLVQLRGIVVLAHAGSDLRRMGSADPAQKGEPGFAGPVGKAWLTDVFFLKEALVVFPSKSHAQGSKPVLP